MAIESGYRVYGPNSSSGEMHLWYFPTLELANHFAKILCGEVQERVVVMKYLGEWLPVKPPVEFHEAKD